MAASTYKKYVLFILCTFLSLYLLSVLWLFTGYCNPRKDSAWIDSLYQKKEAFARSINGPKIVIVSGSSGLFGISAAQIETHFKVPTVNLCTHGALMDYYMYRAKKNINPGDLVILAPEYRQYFNNIPMSDIKSDYIVNFDKSCLKGLPIDEKFNIFKAYAHPWKLIKTKLFDLDKKKSQRKNGGYRSDTLNRNGDETSNHGTKKRIIKPLPMNRFFDANKYGIGKITEFINWCERKGAMVIITWPGTLPFKKTARNSDFLFMDELIKFLSDLDIEILGNPEDFFVPRQYLFDTIYHLNTDGVTFRTSKLIHFLTINQSFKEWLKDGVGKFHQVVPAFDPPRLFDIFFNGSMEKNSNTQPLGWKAIIRKRINPDSIVQWDNSEAHSGKYSLKIKNVSSEQSLWVGEKILLPSGVQRIHAGGWSKAENIGDHARYCINIKTFFKDGTFKWNARGLHFSSGTHDWKQVQTVFNFNEDVIAVKPFIILYGGTGTAWFDDIFIRIPKST